MSQQRADQLVEAGLWLKLSGDTEGARRLFEQALKLDPGNARAKQLLELKGAQVNPDPSPPGAQAPASNAPPAKSGSLIEQDWAMATGMLAERGMTPPPVAPSSRVEVPDTPAQERPKPDPLMNTKPWESDATAAPSTLIWGQKPGPPVPVVPAPDAVPGETREFGRPDLDAPEPPPSPTPTSTAIWGANAVPPNLHRRELTPPMVVESAWDGGTMTPEPVPPAAQMGSAMDLVTKPVPSFTPPPGSLSKRVIDDEVRTLLKGAKDLLDLDDHTGAIDLILKAQELAPMDPDVAKMRERSEKILQDMFESKLGSMEKRPRVVLKNDEIIWLNLDHRAGFVLAQIDGTVTFEDLFAVSGMSRLDTARILAQLMDEGVIKA